MIQFTYKLKVAERIKARCERHPRYNPERDGRGGIRGGCSTCFAHSEDWSWLPRSLERKFDRKRLPKVDGEFWEAALAEFPKATMEYLSRTGKMAKDSHVRVTLVVWPRIMQEHRKQRAGKKTSI